MTAPPVGEYGTREWLERCLFERTHEPVLCTSCYPAPYHNHKRIVVYRNRCQGLCLKSPADDRLLGQPRDF